MTTPEPSTAAPPRRRWQVGLRTVVLLTAAAAVWLSYGLELRRIDDLKARIDSLRPLARELVVDDPNMIAVVKHEELWYDENAWDVHLPAGRRYHLCLATREIDAASSSPPGPSRTVPMEPGRRVITLDQVKDGDGWRVDVSYDGKVAASATEPKDWYPGTGSTGGGHFSSGRQSAADEPVVLFHRRFSGPRDANGRAPTPNGPADGVVLWIEPVADPPPPAAPPGPTVP